MVRDSNYDSDLWKQGWFWGMVALAAATSIVGRWTWARFINPGTAPVVGDFLLFTVIMGSMASRTAPNPPPLGRRIPIVLFSAGVGAAVMAVLRGFLI